MGSPTIEKLRKEIVSLLGAEWSVILEAIKLYELRERFRLCLPLLSVKHRQHLAGLIYVEYDRLLSIKRQIAKCHTSYGWREPKCAYICGDTGAGKSTLLENYPSLNHRIEGPEGTTVPVLAMTITPNATERSLAASLLHALGDRYWDRGSKAILFQRAIQMVRACQVELLILDEFQHLVDSRTDRIINAVADWVKTLIVESRVPVVAFGQRTGSIIFDDAKYEQLGRRFPIREEIAPFTVRTKEGYQEFATFLHAVDLALPLQEPSNLADRAIVEAIWAATGGVVSYVMDLITESMKIAVDDKRESITSKDFTRGFQSAIQTRKPKVKNPFSARGTRVK